MPIPDTHRDKSRPYRLAHGPISGFPETEAAAVDLVSELLFHGVKKRLVNEIMRDAVRSHFPEPVPAQRMQAWLQEGANEAKDRTSRVRSIDKTNDLDSQSVSHHAALREVVKCLFSKFNTDEDCFEIDAYWTGILKGTPPPGVVTLPYGTNGSEKAVAAYLMRHIGSVDSFVYSVHSKCKPKDLLQAFISVARFAPPRDRASIHSEPADLVDACLNVLCWDGTKDDVRGKGVRLEHRPGIYPNEGVALFNDDDTGALMLYVLPGAVIRNLSDQFKKRRVGAITKLLQKAPGCVQTKTGYSSPRKVRDAFKNPKSVGINIDLFRAALAQAAEDAAAPAVPKALDPDLDGREPAPIVTPYSASSAASPADHTAFMLSDAPASDSRPGSDGHPLATQSQPSLTLYTRENPVSFPGDTSVSGQGCDEKSVATLPNGKNPNETSHLGWQRGGN